MDHQYQSPNFVKIARPGKTHKANSHRMMYKHHQKVLSFDIKKLCNEQAPVERQFAHVPPPDIRFHIMIRVIVPAILQNMEMLSFQIAPDSLLNLKGKTIGHQRRPYLRVFTKVRS